MSLPSSEPLPNDINDLPPARQRHIRRQPRSASIAERQILLDSLVLLTSPTLNYFGLSLLGALMAGAALYLNDPAVLILAIVVFPFFKPLFGLALLPKTGKLGQALKLILSLLIPILLAFNAGIMAGWLQKTSSLDNVSVDRFGALYWLDLAILGASVFFSALFLLRKGRLPRLAGVILSYEIFMPFAAAGFAFPLGYSLLWPGALLVGFTHLGAALVMAILAFLILGFTPKRAKGWLVALLPLAFTLALLAFTLNMNIQTNPISAIPSPTPVTLLAPTQTLTPAPLASATEVPVTATSTTTLTQTSQPSPTQTLTPTPSPTPTATSFLAVIDVLTGAVVRESPDFTAEVVGYVNNGDQIEIIGEVSPQGASQWYQVRLDTETTGWMLASLANTQTPVPSATP